MATSASGHITGKDVVLQVILEGSGRGEASETGAAGQCDGFARLVKQYGHRLAELWLFSDTSKGGQLTNQRPNL
ncbi:hypothetical protein [Burkholderia cenocepacia]